MKRSQREDLNQRPPAWKSESQDTTLEPQYRTVLVGKVSNEPHVLGGSDLS